MIPQPKEVSSRKARIERITKETQIIVDLSLDGVGNYGISIKAYKGEPGATMKYMKEESVKSTIRENFSVSPVLDLLTHLLEQTAKHGYFDLYIKAEGDYPHHVYEDVGLTLGQAFSKAMGDKKGIYRVGNCRWPFQGSIADVTLDISGRPKCILETDIKDEALRTMVGHFYESLAQKAEIDFFGRAKTIDIGMHNDHHLAEALYKATGRALHQATRIYESGKEMVPSTKGMI